jgi:aldehyde:ferredoxin oxidoreductase
MYGHHGRYLRVELERAEGHVVPLDETTLRCFLGGVGLGSVLLAREMPAGADPLGPEAALIFAFSPLVGTPLTTSAKFAVVAWSPLTGRVCDALSSSRFAIAGKRVGVDAIVLKGAAPAPSLLFVEGASDGDPIVRLEPAGDLWGRPAREVEESIRERFGADWQVAAIGPAGAAGIPFATISHDGRHAGRGGLGAVLGSKRLAAVAVRGERRVAVADPDAVLALARDLSRRSFGPATEKYRELGTVANLLVFNRLDCLPTRNFGAGHFDNAERLATADLAPARRVARNSCASCTIGCEHVYESGDRGVRLEYESLFALGPLCGVDDPESVLKAAALCDELGLDTITTGGTIAFAMDCAEAGLIDPTLPTGRRLAFGDGAAVRDAIGAIARREGLGALLALGSRRAAGRIGGDAPDRAMHVKGLELPGYNPKSLPAMALGLAVGTRGADHNRSSAYESDFAPGSHARTEAEIASGAIASEEKAALLDSLILCKFLRGVFTDLAAESAELLRAVSGWDVDAAELRAVAGRIVIARRLLNERAGWTRAEDVLPPRLLADDSPLSRARLDRLIAAYHDARGLDESGRVPPALRARLGLDDPGFDG